MLITSLVSFCPSQLPSSGREGSLLCPGCSLPERATAAVYSVTAAQRRLHAQTVWQPTSFLFPLPLPPATPVRAEALVVLTLKVTACRSPMAAPMPRFAAAGRRTSADPCHLEHIRQRGFDQAQLTARRLRAAAVCQSPCSCPVPVSTTKGSDRATRHQLCLMRSPLLALSTGQ